MTICDLRYKDVDAKLMLTVLLHYDPQSSSHPPPLSQDSDFRSDTTQRGAL